jgi:hypothetical protein
MGVSEMQHDATFNLDCCHEMDFDELAVYVTDCLERMDDTYPAGDRPHTKDQFLAVWKVLRQKSDAIPPDPPPPRTPLEKAYDKRARTEKFLYSNAPGHKISKKDRRRIERDLDRLDREIERMEASGQYDQPPDPAPETPKQRTARIASEVFWAIEHAFEDRRQLTRRRLQWRPARPGSLSVSSIRRYYEERHRHEPELKYDITRIEKAKELGPDEPPWEGPDGYEGYLIYTFSDTTKALMECPEIGNAAFVIHKDWETWSQMDKQELMEEAERGGDVPRILHLGNDWPDKIRRELGRE